MDTEEIREYCLKKKGVSEGFPFDETTLVFKVMGKMFALLDLIGKFDLGLKCDPERAIDLREHYSSIKPGYHLNKKYWNNVLLHGDVDELLNVVAFRDYQPHWQSAGMVQHGRDGLTAAGEIHFYQHGADLFLQN